MGRAVNLSPLGLYEWDNNLFALMQIPDALDRDTLIKNLLAETAELEVLYPNPVVFKNLIGVWSAKQIDIWNRLYETTQYEYNPIENYNRYETGSDSGTGSRTHSGTDRDTRTTAHTGTDQSHNTEGGWIAGFDSVPAGQDDGLVKQTRNESDGTFTHGETITQNGSLTHGEQIAMENDSEHNLHAHGNIGVTTTQKLIREQRQIDLFNLYDIIIEDFKMRFCILVY